MSAAHKGVRLRIFLWVVGIGCMCLSACFAKVERVCRDNKNCALTATPTVCYQSRCLTKACDPGQLQRCFTGPANARNKGVCIEGWQRCVRNGSAWSPCYAQRLPTSEICDGADNDCDGDIDEGLTCTCTQNQRRLCFAGPRDATNVTNATCHRGTQLCTKALRWGPCTQQTLPQETLIDALAKATTNAAREALLLSCYDRDTNCDGTLDADPTCACKQGESRPCYTGPPGSTQDPKDPQDVRPCKAGLQRCVEDPETQTWRWGGCTDQILPKPEEAPEGKDATCNGKDDDCDGKIDNQSGTKTPLWRPCSDDPSGCTLQYCEGTNWSLCDGYELCSNNRDDNCDGKIDEATCIGHPPVSPQP